MDVWSGAYMRATDTLLMGHGNLAKGKGHRRLKSLQDTNL